MPAGEVSSPATVPSGLILKGNNAGVSSDSDSREEETVISAVLTFEGDVSIDGVKITARPVFEAPQAISITNSLVENVEIPMGTTSHLLSAVIGISQSEPVKLVLEDNAFGNNTGVYNLFEVNAPYGDGTVISGNTFSAGSCSHNQINVYDAEDGTNIKITDNQFEKSANALRVGTKGAVKDVNIVLNNNSYDATDSSPAWAGLMLIQPYGTATTDMSGVTINMNNTVNNTDQDQLWYYYAGTKDAQLSDDLRPVLYIDGVRQEYVD